jgi:pyruvate/2-oxoglutarate dehydrogenase complex dihydrolipoamide acyltransferase (E2) component
MRYEVTLPSLGEETDGTATVSFWLVGEGDAVRKGDDLVELITDKASFTLPSPKKGTMVEKLVEEDEEVHVGDALCVLEV